MVFERWLSNIDVLEAVGQGVQDVETGLPSTSGSEL